MRLVALLDPSAPIPVQLAWVLALARAGDEDVLLLAAGSPSSADATSKAPAPVSPERIVAQVRNELGRIAGFRLAESGAARAEPSADGGALHNVRVEFPSGPEELAARVQDHDTDLLLVLAARVGAGDARLKEIGRHLLPAVTCRVGILRFGTEPPPIATQLLVPGADGPHSRAALQLAMSLSTAVNHRPTALMVQRPIGVDSERVGHRALDRALRRALGDPASSSFEHQVELEDDLDRGFAKAIDRGRHNLLVMGTWLGQLDSRFLGTPAGRLLRRGDGPAVLALREAMPFTNRIRRITEKFLQSRIPQLVRDDRVALVERVQSNSAWTFDFVALIGLATLIASIGLLQDSAAVVIGAMLVAPLMTPILGIGLALVQGNAALVRSALASVGLGVGLAFVLAFTVGLIAAGPDPTDEMLGRGAPDLKDLFVAFFSGLAAAYATSRPSLFSALPGVAIAAALVPPIATSGLATAQADFRLAGSAMLLFSTNLVAIVISAGLSLWAVGLRSPQGTARWMTALRTVLGIGLLTVILGLRLSAAGESAAIQDCRRQVSSWAGERGLALERFQATSTSSQLAIEIRFAGPHPLPATQHDGLWTLVTASFRGTPVRLQISHAFRIFPESD